MSSAIADLSLLQSVRDEVWTGREPLWGPPAAPPPSFPPLFAFLFAFLLAKRVAYKEDTQDSCMSDEEEADRRILKLIWTM